MRSIRDVRQRRDRRRGEPIGAVRLSADAGLGARQFGAADFYSPYPSFETTRSGTASMRAHASVGERLTLSGAAHTRRHSDVFTLKRDEPAFYQNVHHSWQHGGEASGRLALASHVHAVVGGEVLDARLRRASTCGSISASADFACRSRR